MHCDLERPAQLAASSGKNLATDCRGAYGRLAMTDAR